MYFICKGLINDSTFNEYTYNLIEILKIKVMKYQLKMLLKVIITYSLYT